MDRISPCGGDDEGSIPPGGISSKIMILYRLPKNPGECRGVGHRMSHRRELVLLCVLLPAGSYLDISNLLVDSRFDFAHII